MCNMPYRPVQFQSSPSETAGKKNEDIKPYETRDSPWKLNPLPETRTSPNNGEEYRNR